MTDKTRPTAEFDTEAVWAAEEGPFPYGAATMPIVNSATFAYPDLDSWQAVALHQREGHIYSRNSNPTLAVLEAKIARLDGAEAGAGFATGMAAISSTLFALLSPGDRVVSIKDSYGGTNVLFEEFLPRFGIQATLCNTSDFAQLEREIALGCKLLYLETPTNPTLKVVDIERLSAIAHHHGAVVVTDNTFATPYNQLPAALGSDLVLYSATKFLGGHSDVMGGLVTGSAELVQRVHHFREIAGATLHADAAYAILRGMKTLGLRMARHNQSAQTIAEHLRRHPKVVAVYYPGLDTHPGHAIAARQMRGFGGVLSFVPRGGALKLRTVLNALQLAQRAAHLGGVATTAGPPAVTSHVELTAEERARAGIPETLIRYSVGIEDATDLIADLDQALARI
ncbi:MAG: aminotransferase class I/II-fold pyridoxal phosphate-dependent enzyme [Pseudomonadota bacterium]